MWRFFEPPELAEGEERPEQLMPDPGELITDKADRGALLRSLRTLDRRATQEYMDKGLWILYLAAGFLRWIDPDTKEETRVRSCSFRSTLRRDNPRAPYRLTRGRRGARRQSRAQLEARELGLALPELDDPDEPDLDAYFDVVRNLVRGEKAGRLYNASSSAISRFTKR